MEYSEDKCIKMIEEFNSKSFADKLILLRDRSDIIYLEVDNGWSGIRFTGMDSEVEDEISNKLWFEWDGECFVDSENMWELMLMAGIVGKVDY
jgi:hypothetical protein